jgi:hypothetical protein
MTRWWRRRQPWRPARRCGWCGWYPPGPFGYVAGRHDPAYIGHAPACPSSLYKGIVSAEGVADQWAAIGAWSGMAQEVGMPAWEDLWKQLAWSLMLRADQLQVPFPVPDDTRELAEVR